MSPRAGAPPPRSWSRPLRESRSLSALRAAAVACMRDACERHRPEACECPEQRITPLEFVAWIEESLRHQESPPVRFEPGGRPGRRLGSISGVSRP